MMSKLKTLKDFKCECYGCQDYGRHIVEKNGAICFEENEQSAVNVFELRSDAIKWIKELRDLPEVAYYKRYNLPDYQLSENVDGVNRGITDVIEWIKHFFNITEEELK
jgi:hypothetical protein